MNLRSSNATMCNHLPIKFTFTVGNYHITSCSIWLHVLRDNYLWSSVIQNSNFTSWIDITMTENKSNTARLHIRVNIPKFSTWSYVTIMTVRDLGEQGNMQFTWAQGPYTVAICGTKPKSRGTLPLSSDIPLSAVPKDECQASGNVRQKGSEVCFVVNEVLKVHSSTIRHCSEAS
jgi:hypothetical protein